MKLLFVTGTLGKGGAEKQLFYLCRLLKSNNHEIKVLSFTSREYYEEKIRDLGIDVQNITPSKNKLLKLYQIFKHVNEYKPNVIYGFHFYTGFYVGLIGRLTSILSIGSIRSNGIAEKKSNGIFAWLHYACPKLIIANSMNAIGNVHRVFYKKDVRYLPNIIDLEYFSIQEKNKSNKIHLLFIGSLKPIKQPDLFIQIIQKLVAKNIEVSAEIIGKGAMEEALKIQAKDLPILFLGELDDVRKNLYKADYLISTSSLEGTPNVMLEAFACGTSVFALNHNGLNNWVKADLLKTGNTIDEIVMLLIKGRANNNVLNSRKFLEIEHSELTVLRILNDIFALK